MWSSAVGQFLNGIKFLLGQRPHGRLYCDIGVIVFLHEYGGIEGVLMKHHSPETSRVGTLALLSRLIAFSVTLTDRFIAVKPYDLLFGTEALELTLSDD